MLVVGLTVTGVSSSLFSNVFRRLLSWYAVEVLEYIDMEPRPNIYGGYNNMHDLKRWFLNYTVQSEYLHVVRIFITYSIRNVWTSF